MQRPGCIKNVLNCSVCTWIHLTVVSLLDNKYLRILFVINKQNFITILALDDNHDNKGKLYTYTGRTSIQPFPVL
jgi:hypothetical protein